MAERYTKNILLTSFGTLEPVGYVMVAVPSAEAVAAAVQALTNVGFSSDDVLYFTPSKVTQYMEEGLRHNSGAGDFGYELALMRRYLKPAQEGYLCLLIYAPESAQTEKVKALLEPLINQAAG